MSARLLFIGLLNFSDDRGNLQRSAKKIKMQVFPADNVDCEPLLQELISHGVLIEYSVNDEKYLNVKNFLKHQVVNRPSKSSIPRMDGSVDTPEPLTEDSEREGKGREGKGIKQPRRASAKIPVPENFGISERVQRWAKERGLDQLERHLENFLSYARRNGKTYADWDEALMGAIRENWAKLPAKPAGPVWAGAQ